MYFLCMDVHGGCTFTFTSLCLASSPFAPHFSARWSCNPFGSTMFLHCLCMSSPVTPLIKVCLQLDICSSKTFCTKLQLLGIFHPRTGWCAMDLVALGWNIHMCSIWCQHRITWQARRSLAALFLTLLLGLLWSQAALLKNNGHKGTHGHGYQAEEDNENVIHWGEETERKQFRGLSTCRKLESSCIIMHQVSYNEVTVAVDLFHTFSSHKTLQEPTRSAPPKNGIKCFIQVPTKHLQWEGLANNLEEYGRINL